MTFSTICVFFISKHHVSNFQLNSKQISSNFQVNLTPCNITDAHMNQSWVHSSHYHITCPLSCYFLLLFFFFLVFVCKVQHRVVSHLWCCGIFFVFVFIINSLLNYVLSFFFMLPLCLHCQQLSYGTKHVALCCYNN